MLRNQLQGPLQPSERAGQQLNATNFDAYTPFLKSGTDAAQPQAEVPAQAGAPDDGNAHVIAGVPGTAKASSTDQSAAHVLLSLRGK